MLHFVYCIERLVVNVRVVEHRVEGNMTDVACQACPVRERTSQWITTICKSLTRYNIRPSLHSRTCDKMYCVNFYKRVGCCHLEHMRGTGVEGDKSGEGTMQRMARQRVGKEDEEKEDEGKNRHNPCPRMQIATAVPGSALAI